jgi:NAD(P)-dependent dehydrogenase (short-subunit alcohol dehydrogenase family)
MVTSAARLDGKVVFVTGGGRGLGRVVALRCAEAGADVVLAARSRDALEEVATVIRATGRRALPVTVDLRDHGSLAAAVDATRDELGPIDLAVANSGVAGPTTPIWQVTSEEWAETLDVNVTGAFLTCREVIPDMIERGRGSIVVIGSMTGKRPLQHRSPYAASKAALIGLVRTAASDVGPHGVRINLVSPGPIEGERLDRVFEEQARSRGITVEQARQEFADVSPLRRNVEADDVASAVLFLLSDEARSITGEDLNVSSGVVTY